MINNNTFRDAVEVTPADDGELNLAGLYVGTTGDVKVTCEGGGEVVFDAVPAGTILPVRISRVWATGTAASDIVGLLA